MSDPAPKRRLPFKPTALRKAKSDTPQVPEAGGDGEEDDLALFRRSRHMMPMMTADAERRVKREKEKEEARKRRSETAERGESEPGSAQKRRASECEAAEDERSYSTPSRQFSTPSSSSKRRPGDSTSPTQFNTPTRVMESSTPTPQPSLGDAITVLDDDNGVSTSTPQADSPVKGSVPRWAADSFRATGSSTPAPGTTVEIIDDEDEGEVEEVTAPSEEETDPELQVFINAARERQRLAESQESQESGPSVENYKVQVESTIPRTVSGGKPLTFRLRSTDPLKSLKTTWCSVMQMNHVDLTAEAVFFTWRGRRLYNTTTLRGLGISTMGNDLLYAADVGDRRGFSADRRRVVLCAWTEELFEAHLAEEEREERRRRGELDEEEVVQESAPVEEKIKVAMRPKQGEPVKVSVTASSTVGGLVEKFRAKRALPAEAKVAIYFDGERLGEGVTLQDADIGDDDQVEVHLS